MYEEKQNISGGIWNSRDPLNFTFTISDTNGIYKMYLDFEHAADFPTQNIYLKVQTRFPDGNRPAQAISFDFFDSKGASFGKCSGETCRAMAAAARDAGHSDVRWFATKEEASAEVAALLQPGDYVLVKASRGEAFETILPVLEEAK